MTIGDLLREQASDRVDAAALRELLADGSIGREWTYAGLLRECETLGRALASRHQRGARIAIFANNIPEWVLMEMAAGLAGLTLVTVNPAFHARELRYVLEQSRAEAVYFAASVRGNALGPVVEAACADLPAVSHRIALSDRTALFNGEATGALRSTQPDDIVQIQYTSGTTGFPKGALLSQRGPGSERARFDLSLGGGAGRPDFDHDAAISHCGVRGAGCWCSAAWPTGLRCCSRRVSMPR